MPFKDLLPLRRRRTDVPGRYEEEHPLSIVQKEMNRLFDDFSRGFDVAPFSAMRERLGTFSPSLDVKEDDKAITVKAELPGMDEKDVEVLLTDDALTLKGEKKEDKEEKRENYYHVERTYGSFHRVIPLAAAIDTKKVNATFKNGVLVVTLPKTEEAKMKGKKIPVNVE
jgi:HSP20 family protein